MDTPEDTLEARLVRVRQREAFRALRKREWVVLGFFLILALLCWVNFRRVVVHGVSMEPSYHSGQTLVVWKLAPRAALKPGDVIVFRQGEDELIKRVFFVAPPQEAAHFPPKGFPPRVTNPAGWSVRDPRLTFLPLFYAIRTGQRSPPPPENMIYVVGDNLPVSDDSRDFGPISPKQILGKVIP